MKLDGHIATRFLTDESIWWEIVETTYPDWALAIEDEAIGSKVASLLRTVNIVDNKSYYVTETVLDKLDMLKVKKRLIEPYGEQYDWTVFKQVAKSKRTYIFPGNSLLRVIVDEHKIAFVHLNMTVDKSKKNWGEAYWVMFYIDRITGEQCEHFGHRDVKQMEEFIYKLLCFVYLSENEEILVPAGGRHGTKKQGKLMNTLPFPVTIINSRWNVTSVRTEGFDVSAHFAIRWTGEGRKVARMVFIQPFEKHGYIRKAQNIQEQ